MQLPHRVVIIDRVFNKPAIFKFRFSAAVKMQYTVNGYECTDK